MAGDAEGADLGEMLPGSFDHGNEASVDFLGCQAGGANGGKIEIELQLWGSRHEAPNKGARI